LRCWSFTWVQQSSRAGRSLRCQYLPSARGLVVWLWYSGFVKILLVLGLAFILLLLLVILMFVSFALL
jgi:hypothetical protein